MSLLSRTILKIEPARRIARTALQKRRAAILMYHGVTDAPLPVFNWCHLPADEFRRQAEWIAQTYRVLPLTEIVGLLRDGRALPDRAACITFDDAFRNLARNAAPVLESLQLPYTVFVVGRLADSGAPPWAEQLFAALLDSPHAAIEWLSRNWALGAPRDRQLFYEEAMAALTRMPADRRGVELENATRALGAPSAGLAAAFATMTRDELRRLTSSGLCSLGSHSNTHEILTTCSEATIRDELNASRKAIQDEPGFCDLFAYPNGDCSPAVARAVREAGFQGAVTVEHRLCRAGDDVFRIPRVGIGAGLPMELFECKVLGF